MHPLHRSSYRPAHRVTKYLPLSRTPSHRAKPRIISTSRQSAEKFADESVTINIEFSYRSQSSGTSTLQKNRKPSEPKSKRPSRDDTSNGDAGYEDATPRPSIDFPTAVIEAARRASVLGRSGADSLSAPEAVSSSERGDHTNSRSPSTSYSSCIDDERKFSSPHRRRVVDVSDHKTCALLMTRMKEASRQLPSPSQ